MDPQPTTVTALRDLHVRLTSQCNLNCAHCYASDWFSRKNVLDSTLVERAITEALPLGLKKVTFTGGEPTLHADLARLLQYCVDRQLKTKLETNGLLLKAQSSAKRVLVDNRDLLYLYISYDLAGQRGITEQQHEVIRDLVLDLHRSKVDVRLQTTLTRINVAHLDELIMLCREHGIHQRVFLGHSTSGSGVDLRPLEFDMVMELFHRLNAMKLNMAIELPPLISGRVQDGCGWGLHRCELMANGDVTTCGPTTFTNTGFIAGNLHNSPLREIWCESDFFQGMRQVTQKNFRGVCGRCSFFEACRGSCRSVAWSRGEDWFSSYPLCETYAERYPAVVAGLLGTREDRDIPSHGAFHTAQERAASPTN